METHPFWPAVLLLFIHLLIPSYTFIEPFLCAKHFAECIHDAFLTTQRQTPYTFSPRPQLFLILLFPWKILLWSIPFSNERNKKNSSELVLHLEIAYVLKILFAYFQDAVDFISLDLSYECHSEADLPQTLSELQVT